jgi:hypothetical protein
LLQSRELELEHPWPIRILLNQAAQHSGNVHPKVYAATDPDDILKRRQTDDMGVRVFRDYETGRHYLVGLGVHDRNTMMSGMAFEKRPAEALIIYCELKNEAEIKKYEAVAARIRKVGK